MNSPAPDVVERVRAALAPEPRFVASRPNGFTWWPFACAQHVWAEGPVRAGGELLARVRVRIEIARGVAASPRSFAGLSDWNVGHPGLSALRWDGETGGVALECSAHVQGADADVVARALAGAALLQLGDAARDTELIVRELGGARADSAAPGQSVRQDKDALVEAWRELLEAQCAAPAGPDDLVRAAGATPAPWAHANVEGDALIAELPPAPGAAAEPGATAEHAASLQVQVGVQHPVLGRGVLAALRLGALPAGGPERGPATAALLNEAEVREWTGFDAAGAWCVHPTLDLAHVSFHPDVFADAELPARLAWIALRRARWAQGVLADVASMRRAR